MAPTRAALGVGCVDYYWANAIVHNDGSIRNPTKFALLQSNNDDEAELLGDPSALQSISRPYIILPHMDGPDIRLYLNIERPV
jgi:hypothetical protein